MVQAGPIHLTLPNDLADIIRARLAGGEFASAEEVVRAALVLLDAGEGGDDANTIRQKIDAGFHEAQAGRLIDGGAAMNRWRERQGQQPGDCGQ